LADKIELRTLGKSELRVSPIGLGCWQFSRGIGLSGWFWPDLPEDTIDAIIKSSLEQGVNWFDTAEMYGRGASEAALSRHLHESGIKQGEVIIATKWWPLFRSAKSIYMTINVRMIQGGGISTKSHTAKGCS